MKHLYITTLLLALSACAHAVQDGATEDERAAARMEQLQKDVNAMKQQQQDSALRRY